MFMRASFLSLALIVAPVYYGNADMFLTNFLLRLAKSPSPANAIEAMISETRRNIKHLGAQFVAAMRYSILDTRYSIALWTAAWPLFGAASCAILALLAREALGILAYIQKQRGYFCTHEKQHEQAESH
jgi:hypothetical protein